MKLTKSAVDALQLPTKGQVLVWDQETRGFGIRLTPGGKTYIAQGRVGRKERRVSLGKHGIITTVQARERAKEELAKMSGGIDPAVEKKRQEALSVTLDMVVTEYLKDRELRPASIADINRHMVVTFPDWRYKPVADITRDKVKELFIEKAEVSPAQANQAFRILRALLNYARATYRPDEKPILLENPVSVLSDAKLWKKIQPRSRRVAPLQVGAFWNRLQGIREERSDSIGADYIAFLLLTGCRRSEAAKLTWSRVNLDEGWWYLPDPKNKNSVTLPLSTTLVDILKQRPRNSEYVFPNSARNPKTGYINNARKLFIRLAPTPDQMVTPHDLRRTFRAVAGECKIEFWKIKLLLNHQTGDITIRHYTETNDLRYLAPEAEQIAKWITRQGKIAAEPKIVDLAARRASNAS